MKVFASILASDHLRLGAEIDRAVHAGVDGLHVDVMDGHYVNNIIFGPLVTREVRNHTTLPLHAHFMVEKPEKFLDEYCRMGVEWITVHYENCKDLAQAIDTIHRKGCKVVVAINLETPVFLLEPWLHLLDGVLIISVEVGIGGQKYNKAATEKIKQLHKMAQIERSDLEIFVDGGVNLENICHIRDAGATTAIIGTALFAANDMDSQMRIIRKELDKKAC